MNMKKASETISLSTLQDHIASLEERVSSLEASFKSRGSGKYNHLYQKLDDLKVGQSFSYKKIAKTEAPQASMWHRFRDSGKKFKSMNTDEAVIFLREK